ncbi:MAG: vWA domain-containing protein [Myxococcota bacterium]
MGGSLLRRLVQPTVLLLLALLLASGAQAATPSVARPSLAGGASAVDALGLVFFLAIEDAPGAVAVGTAHTFKLEDVARAQRVDFFTGKSLKRVGSSTRLLAEPGRPFSLPGATVRDDFLVYRLDQEPSGIRLLDPSHKAPRRGSRVKVLGVPVRGKKDQDALFGTITEVSDEQLEVDLDLSADLRGWGGAPIVLSKSGRVVGLVEASIDNDGAPRIFAAPIAGVLAALARPLEGGAGREIASWGEGGGRGARPAAPAPPVPPTNQLPTLKASGPTNMQMTIEYPPPGSTVGDSVCGVFVAGRAAALSGEMRQFDVAMVIDTSRSTIDPSGTDIDGDGKIGTHRLGRLGSIFMPTTDPGDSILAAEIAAARQLLSGLDPRSTRVSLVSFAGDTPGYGRQRKPAFTLEPLTREYVRIEKALDALLASEPEGNTHMAAGVDQATIELLGLRGALSTPNPDSEKIVFFFTDGQPTLPYGPEAQADNVRAVLRAANRAGRARVKIHSFAIGPDALEGPIAVVEMASRTRGYFTPVRDPGQLVSVVEEVSFANLDSMALVNKTTREEAQYFRQTADGAWAGLIKMEPGRNQVRAWARADDGAEIEQLREIRMKPDADSPPIPALLASRRNRLLEECLRDAKRLRMTAEEEQAEQVRRDLLIEIERERAKARARADRQRKELELEGDIE